jgi:hypothetical protein
MKHVIPFLDTVEYSSPASALKVFITKQVRETDVLICSYPRSGNTWARHLLSAYLLRSQGHEFDGPLPIHPDKIIPDLHVGSFQDIDASVLSPARLAKTHSAFAPLFSRKIIHLSRNAADSLVSHFHFYRRYEHLQTKIRDFDIDEFVRFLLHVWIHHSMTFVNASSTRDVCHLTYECMHADTPLALTIMLRFLGIVPDSDLVELAVADNEFARLQKRESDNSDPEIFKNNERFFRKGRVGSAREELRGETLEWVEGWSGEVYERLLELQESTVRRHIS